MLFRGRKDSKALSHCGANLEVSSLRTEIHILSHPFLIFGSLRNQAALNYIILNLSFKLVFGDVLNVLSLSHARYSIWITSKYQPAYLEGGGLGVPVPCFLYKNDLSISTLTKQGNMSLTAKDKDVVKAFWTKVSGRADEIGCEAVSR